MSESTSEQRRSGGLGRGLSALLPERSATPGTGPSLREIPIDEIAPNPNQPRTEFSHDALEELAASIRSVGVLQPVVVRRQGAGYQLVMGERRVRAARLAGMRMIPAIVREVADEAMLQDALIENLQRQDLNPIEEAIAIRQLIEEFALTHDDVAGRLGRSRASVTNALRLLGLSTEVQEKIASGALSAAHGRAIAALADRNAQERLAHRAVADQLSVRSVEDLVRTMSQSGEAPIGARARAARTERSAGILEVEHRLGAMLDTRVRVEAGRRGRGRIVIEFGGEEDLDRIWRVIARP